jgi:predicted nucleic acid-binding protein
LEIILDTSILIAAERRREAPEDILRRIMAAFGAVETAISTITVAVSFEIAQLAGKIEGQQAAKGIVVPIADCSSAQQPSTTAIR